MITVAAIRALQHLVKMGHKPLAKKIHKALTTGETAHFKSWDERRAFDVVRKSLLDSKPFKNNKIIFPDGTIIRREGAYQPMFGKHKRGKGPNKDAGKGAYGRGLYTSQKKVPMTDVDLKDPFSHKKEQVIHETLSDFIPAMKDYMGTKRGKKSAFKVYRTAAGMRLFDVSKISRRDKPAYYEEVWDALGGDGSYRGFSIGRGDYSARIMPKPGRTKNIWGLPGNVKTGKFAKQNPGEFIAAQRKPGSIIKGVDADIDPRSLAEVNLYHDMLIRGILERKAKRKGRVPGLEGLMSLIAMK
tara:strand:+ start:9937 stop:10836 length:900 start_codon:yes stop_codon:yes gene_type:complete